MASYIMVIVHFVGIFIQTRVNLYTKQCRCSDKIRGLKIATHKSVSVYVDQNAATRLIDFDFFSRHVPPDLIITV